MPALLVSTVLNRARRHLQSLQRSIYNTVSVDSGATITLSSTAPAIPDGTFAAIDDELVYVQSHTGSAVAVLRGMLGTVQATHSPGALVELNPQYPLFVLRDALAEEVRSWSPSLYRVETGTILTNIGTRGYDIGPGPGPTNVLDPDWIDVIDVRRSTNQSGLAYGYNALVKTWPRVPFRVTRYGDPGDYPGTDHPAAPAPQPSPFPQQGAAGQFQGSYPGDFPSGVGLHIAANYYNTQLAIVWKTRVGPVPDPLPDALDLTALGVDPGWADIAAFGVAARCAMDKESSRNLIGMQGQSRDAQEVPPGAISSQALRWQALRDTRFAQAVRDLASRYPVRFKN